MGRILIADDEQPMRMVVAAILQQHGHIVIEARDGREAVELHRSNPVDLIITDLVMKDMDGTELLRRVRPTSPDTPVIGISGNRHGKIYLNMAKMLGAARILAKPFSADELMAAVNDLLGAHAPLAETAAVKIA
jgi:two-component system, response regulator, stage 0 sporulation protein F